MGSDRSLFLRNVFETIYIAVIYPFFVVWLLTNPYGGRKMKGWRTLLVNLALAIAPVLQATGAADLGLTGNWATGYALSITIINFALRFITTTPVGVKSPNA